MNKASLLFLLTLFLSTAQGQNSLKIEEAVALNEVLTQLMGAARSKTLDPAMLQQALDRKAPVKAGLREVMTNGTQKEKDAAGLLDMLMEFYILNIHFRSGRASAFFSEMVALEPRLFSYNDPKRFPIEYIYQGKRYYYTQNALATTIESHYATMMDHSITLGKNREAIEYCRLTLDAKKTTTIDKYLAITGLQSLLRTMDRPLADIVDAYVEGLEVWKLLDPNTIARIDEKEYRNFNQMADSVLLLSPMLRDGERRAAGVLAAVRQLIRSDTARSMALLKSLSDVNIKSLYNLERMYRYADTLGLASLKSKALTTWEGLDPSDMPQVSSLRATAATVLKTEPAKGKGFKKISGDSTKSRFYTLGALKSSVCLTGAIECITTGFTNTMTGQETSYWQCVVAEEPNANRKGPLQGLYRELCGELGMLYRDDPMEYAYGDPNYYTLKLSKSWEIQISYYLNANTGTDIIMMVVKCVK